MKSEHLSTDKPPKNKDEKLDRALEDSFPTSDPPPHSPGAVGATGAPNDNGKKHFPSDRSERQR